MSCIHKVLHVWLFKKICFFFFYFVYLIFEDIERSYRWYKLKRVAKRMNSSSTFQLRKLQILHMLLYSVQACWPERGFDSQPFVLFFLRWCLIFFFVYKLVVENKHNDITDVHGTWNGRSCGWMSFIVENTMYCFFFARIV